MSLPSITESTITPQLHTYISIPRGLLTGYEPGLSALYVRSYSTMYNVCRYAPADDLAPTRLN